MFEKEFMNEIIELSIDCNDINVFATSLPRFEDKLLNKCSSYRVLNCQLARLEPDAFKTIQTLKKLQLVNDSLERISEYAFIGLNQLEVLNLTNNKITTLKQSMFTALAELNMLVVSYNLLIVLPKNLFKENPKLSEISFKGNQLHVIQAELKNIDIFDFDENPCTSSINYDRKSLQNIKDRCSYEKFYRKVIDKAEKLDREMKGGKEKLENVEHKFQEVSKQLDQIFATLESHAQLLSEMNTSIVSLSERFENLESNLDSDFTNFEYLLENLETKFKESQEIIETNFIDVQNETNNQLESRLNKSINDFEGLVKAHKSLEQSFKDNLEDNEMQKTIFWVLIGFLILIVFDLMLALWLVAREVTK
jgi:Leucine-rich repeat (LRR) protein